MARGFETIESALERLAGWLKSGGEAEAIVPAVSHADDGGVDRLFRHLVPDVTGRRSGHEIINRLRGKWDLDHSLSQILGRVRDQFHGLAELRGPAPVVLERLDQNFAALAPRSIADLGALVKQLAHHGVESSRVELDLGFRPRDRLLHADDLRAGRRDARRARSRSAAAAGTTAWPACSAATATTAASASRSGSSGSWRLVRRHEATV